MLSSLTRRTQILEQHPARNEALRKRSQLHIITLGHSPLVFGVLSGLVHYLLTTPAHPYSTLHPGIGALTREQQTESVPSCAEVDPIDDLRDPTDGSTSPKTAGSPSVRPVRSVPVWCLRSGCTPSSKTRRTARRS